MRALFALLAGCLSVLALAQPYRIDRFDVNLTLEANATLSVEERIAVTFNESRRGIFRVIPIDYDAGNGISRQMMLGQVDVTDENGSGQPTKVSYEGGNVRIRIGDPDVYLPAGTVKTYVLRYRCRGMMNWFEKNEGWGATSELYWNVTGTEWDTEIGAVTCKLNFPTASETKDMRAKVFVGPYGSRANQIVDKVGRPVYSEELETTTQLSNGTLRVERASPMGAYNGLTVVLDMPYGLIEKPGPGEMAWTFLRANSGFLLPLAILPLMALLWFRHGRDPDAGPIAVQFDPPDGLSGSAAGTLLDERVDMRDVAAGIFSLAVKGYLTIEPDEEGFIFKRRTAKIHVNEKQPGPELSEFERQLRHKLHAAGPIVDDSDLREHVAPHIFELKNALYEELVDKGYYVTSPQTARTAWFIGGLVCVIGAGVVCTLLTPYRNPIPAIVGGVVSAIILGVFSRGMPRRTRQGAIARRELQGFEEFVRRARSDEIEWMSQKQPDALMFEKYLPHAIAFGLAREWGQRFEGIVTQPPSWYMAPQGYPFRPTYFASDIFTISNSMGSAAATPPRSSGASGGSSGFGGGGFSGGGFGGGGGGSW